ncbi:hypothetical protein Vafri_17883 [Volvox africanus]|nr:hypothetical protein Vafri_17883 [Volvox africanus]
MSPAARHSNDLQHSLSPSFSREITIIVQAAVQTTLCVLATAVPAPTAPAPLSSATPHHYYDSEEPPLFDPTDPDTTVCEWARDLRLYLEVQGIPATDRGALSSLSAPSRLAKSAAPS